jgi:hypothetical protein
VPEVQPVKAEIHVLVQLLRIKLPPLGAALAAWVRQRGWTALAKPSHSLR